MGMKRTRALYFVGIFFAFSFSPFISSALSAEKIWTVEEIQAGQPGYCTIRSEMESKLKPIFEKMLIAAENVAKNEEQRQGAQKAMKSLLDHFFEIVSGKYLIVEDKNECPEGWPIHPEQER